MLTSASGAADTALVAALTYGGALAEVRTLSDGPRLPIRTAFRLAVYRPDLVITEGRGAIACLAALYRVLMRRSRLLVRVGETGGQLGLMRRLILGQADGVLADDDVADRAIEAWRASALRVFPLSAPCGLEPYLATSLSRSPEEALRLVYSGPLSPQSGVADILLCVAAWAEQNAGRSVEIWWIGEGDLAGVLDAQPLPDNMTQRFLGTLAPEQMAEAFSQCGIMVLPLQATTDPCLVAEALAAGLVVVGNARVGQARRFLSDGTLGWTFDPKRPDQLLSAVSEALSCSPDTLAEMRVRGRDLVRRAANLGAADHLRTALAAIMPGATQAAPSRPAASGAQTAMDHR